MAQKPLTAKEAASIAAGVVKHQEDAAAEPPPRPDECGNCKAYRWHKDENMGRCHHGPPGVFGSSPSTSNAAWPPVLPEFHCEQHKRKT
jgi:hypothetical protein